MGRWLRDRPDYYFRLEGHDAVPCTMEEWGNGTRYVAYQTFGHEAIGERRVSTVFLGLNHNHLGEGPPLLFETMIFGGTHDGYQTRCSTWEEAEVMHRVAVDLVKQEFQTVMREHSGA